MNFSNAALPLPSCPANAMMYSTSSGEDALGVFGVERLGERLGAGARERGRIRLAGDRRRREQCAAASGVACTRNDANPQCCERP
jgi:hypothetical protein